MPNTRDPRTREGDDSRLERIEQLYELTRSDAAQEERTQFMDSLILTSVSRTLGCLSGYASADPLDYRTRFFISEISRFADAIAIRLLSAKTADDRLNYSRPIAFPDMRSCRSGELHAWAASSAEQILTEHGLPDDIDSTFSALYGIRAHAWDRAMPPARICANALRGLESVRLQGFPCLYNTWFEKNPTDSDSAWRSLDIIAMSSPVAFFDSIDPSHMADTRSVIFDKICSYARNPVPSLWFSEFYHSFPLAIYMAARCAWPARQRLRLRELISEIIGNQAARQHSAFAEDARVRPQNRTDAWLYAAAMTRLGGRIDCDDVLFDGNAMDSDSGGDPLFIHSLRENKTTYAESRLFSALVMFESVICSDAAVASSPEDSSMGPVDRDEPVLSPYDSAGMRTAARIRHALLDFEMLRDKADMVESLIDSMDFAICLDACMASGCCASPCGPDDPDPLLAHALGLCAYYIYDKIYDREFHPHYLPVLFLVSAIFQARISRLMECLAEDGVSIPDDVRAILADTDISYYMLARTDPKEKGRSGAWLSLHAKKSLGICLVPTLCSLKAGATSEDARHMQDFFCHFNLARQISDDAKDAEKDESSSDPKATSIRCLESQREIECAIFSEIAAANESLSLISDKSASVSRIKAALQKRLDEFLIKALRAKWELSIIESL